PGGDLDDRGCRNLVVVAVEGHEPGFALLVANGETGGDTGGLGANHRPFAGRRPVAGVGPAGDLFDRYGLRVNPVGEPARVRHLVDGVDVLRADVRGEIALLGEQIQ